MSGFWLISRSRRGCGKVGIPRGLRDFQARWESPFFGLFHGASFHSPSRPNFFCCRPSVISFAFRPRNDFLYFHCPLHRAVFEEDNIRSMLSYFHQLQSGTFPVRFQPDISWINDTSGVPGLLQGAHLAIVLPPRMIRCGSGRLLFLGRGSYCLNWNRAWNLLPNYRPTAIANL
jgi:hypothetical protein